MTSLTRAMLQRSDDHTEARWDVIAAVTVNVIFLALLVLALWPIGRAPLALRLAKGYLVLWVVVGVVSFVVYLLGSLRFFE